MHISSSVIGQMANPVSHGSCRMKLISFSADDCKINDLPSSVYGVYVSNIEQILPGLQVDSMKILGEKCLTEYVPVSQDIFPHESNEAVSDNKKNEIQKLMTLKMGKLEKVVSSDNNADDNSKKFYQTSSVHKMTLPKILEKNKMIPKNEAIVCISDSVKFSTTNNVASSIKDIFSESTCSNSDTSSYSKLQSALLGAKFDCAYPEIAVKNCSFSYNNKIEAISLPKHDSIIKDFLTFKGDCISFEKSEEKAHNHNSKDFDKYSTNKIFGPITNPFCSVIKVNDNSSSLKSADDYCGDLEFYKCIQNDRIRAVSKSCPSLQKNPLKNFFEASGTCNDLSKDDSLKNADVQSDGTSCFFSKEKSLKDSNEIYSNETSCLGFDSGVTSMCLTVEESKEVVKSNCLDKCIFSSESHIENSPALLSGNAQNVDKKFDLVNNSKNFSSVRPKSLPFNKRPLSMVSSTLVSPDTPRPNKSCVQLYINGHAYTYLGLKCSTRSTYCCIYQPQPMFVMQETDPTLSMYSNWQVVPSQKELGGLTPGQIIGLYNSKKHNSNIIYTSAVVDMPMLATHSSYSAHGSQKMKGGSEETRHSTKIQPVTIEEKSIMENQHMEKCQNDFEKNHCDNEKEISERNQCDEDDIDEKNEYTTAYSWQHRKRIKIFDGGFKSNEDYTYIRGRGRGKYVCEECGIRCKKPSVLLKHLRSHTDLRPYKCPLCLFAFKTKGNLTKHQKSKSHHKKCTELVISTCPLSCSSSENGENFTLQEKLENVKYQYFDDDDDDEPDDFLDDSEDIDEESESDSNTMTSSLKSPSGSVDDIVAVNIQSIEQEAARSLLHLSSLNENMQQLPSVSSKDFTDIEPKNVSTFALTTSIQDAFPSLSGQSISTSKSNVNPTCVSEESLRHRPRSYSANTPLYRDKECLQVYQTNKTSENQNSQSNDKCLRRNFLEFDLKEKGTRRYSISVAREAKKVRVIHPHHWDDSVPESSLVKTNESAEQPIDLRIPKTNNAVLSNQSGMTFVNPKTTYHNESPYLDSLNKTNTTERKFIEFEVSMNNDENLGSLVSSEEVQQQIVRQGDSVTNKQLCYQSQDDADYFETIQTEKGLIFDQLDYSGRENFVTSNTSEDSVVNHETVSINKKTTEQSHLQSHPDFMNPGTSNIEDGKCVCRICNKIFAKAGQLRIHVNIHYFERPFRCENCGVSFRTKGHLQKHKRSVSHYNKVNMNMTFGTPSVDNPRPFKCADCKIAFRIHGHLAKHLRSKMHIMKLECLGKLPFGMYAEMERSGISLNEIDTTDCNNSLESLQVMAHRLYHRDPRRMRWQQGLKTIAEFDKFSVDTESEQQPLCTIAMPTIISLNPDNGKTEDVKREPVDEDIAGFTVSSSFVEEVVCLPSSIQNKNSNIPSETSSTVQVERSNTDNAALSSMHRSDTCHLCGRMFKSTKFLQVHLYCDHSSWDTSSAEFTVENSDFTTAAAVAKDVTCNICCKSFQNHIDLQQHVLSHTHPVTSQKNAECI